MKNSLVPFLCCLRNRRGALGIALLIALSFASQNTQGQCTLSPSAVTAYKSGIICPDSTFYISVDALPNQTYSFFLNNQPIPNFQHLSNLAGGTIFYTVANMSITNAGTYSVITYDTCGSGTFLFLDSVFVYFSGIAALPIDLVNDTSANFHWIGGPPGSNYTWAIDLTNTFPQSGDSLFSGNTTDTLATVTGLQEGTKYYVFVTNKNSPCSVNPVWFVDSFTTPCPASLASSAVWGAGVYCAGANPSITVVSPNHAQNYLWYRAGVLLQKLPGNTNGPLSYTVTDLATSKTETIKVITTDNCGDTLLLSNINLNYAQISGFAINQVQSHSVSFKWNALGAPLADTTQRKYQWAISTTPPSPVDMSPPAASIVLTNDTFALPSGLTGNTTYYIYVAPTCQFGTGPLWDTLSFTTLLACTANFDSLPVITSANTSFSICPGGSIVLQSNSNTGNQWFKNNILVLDSTRSQFIATDSGAYSITVTDTAGCHAASPPKSVIILPAPAVPVITGSGPLTFCSGSSVVLGSSANSSYRWFKNDTATGQTTQTIAVTSSGSYTVQVTNPSGCSAVSLPTVVTVNQTPPVPIITPSGPLIFCSGNNVVLSSSTANSYQWLDNDSAIGQTSQTLSVNLSGSYKVKVTTASGCSATSVPTVVTVNPTPAVPVITASGPLSFCTGASVTLTSSIGSNYLWFKNDTVTGQTNQSLIASVSGSYTVQVISGSGCSATSAPIVVTVNPTPLGPLITPSGPLSFCSGGSVVLNSSSGNSYTWFRNDTTLVGQTGPNITAAISGSYTVQITNVSGCFAISGPTTVTVFPTPPAPIITPSGSLNFCTGGNVVLNSSSGSGYTWYRNDTIIGQTSQNLTVISSGSYTVLVTQATGCFSTSDPAVVSVNPTPLPPSITPSGSLNFCPGGSVVLTSSTGNSYIWYRNDTAIGQTGQNITVNNSGSYTVTVTFAAGCSATSGATVVNSNLTAPVAAITPLGPLTFCSGGTVVLSSSTGNSYTWFRNDTAIGQTTQNITVNTSGSYTVQVSSSGGCSAVSSPITVMVNPIPPVPTISGRTVLNSCSGDADTLLSSSLTGNQWMNNNSPIAGEINTTLIVHVSGNYSVQVTNQGLCISTSASTSVTAIGSSPKPTINPTGTVTFCAGDSSLLTSSLTFGNQWYKDGVPLTGDTLQTLYVSVSGNYTVFGGNGLCASQSVPTIVSSSGIQGAINIIVTGSLTICQGGSILLQSSISIGNQWYFNGQALFGENGPTLSASAAGNYIVAVGTGACQVFSTAAIVSVVANPLVPVITSNGTDLCVGTVLLQSSSDSGNVWYLDTVPIPGATGNTYSPPIPGKYSVMVSFGGNCSSLSEPVNVAGSTGVTPSISILNGVLSTDSLIGDQWYRNDSLIPGATSNTYIPRQTGTYTVRINHRGCLSNFSAPLVVTEDNLTTPNVSVYPNPATDHITILNKGSNPLMLQLYDMAGRSLQNIESITGTYQVLIAQLSRGPYYILITDQVTKNKTRKLIIKL